MNVLSLTQYKLSFADKISLNIGTVSATIHKRKPIVNAINIEIPILENFASYPMTS